MAIEFNVTAADHFFLGEDKVLEFVVFDLDGTTPFNVAGLSLEWNMRRTDKAGDPAILTKTPTVVGVFNSNPATNTQRVRVTFASDDTDPLVTTLYTLKAGFAYRHSLKRKDAGNEIILSYGSLTFLQATER